MASDRLTSRQVAIDFPRARKRLAENFPAPGRRSVGNPQQSDASEEGDDEDMPPSPLITTNDAARQLGVPRYQVVRWIVAGYLPAKRIGRRWWITQSALDAFVRSDEDE